MHSMTFSHEYVRYYLATNYCLSKPGFERRMTDKQTFWEEKLCVGRGRMDLRMNETQFIGFMDHMREECVGPVWVHV